MTTKTAVKSQGNTKSNNKGSDGAKASKSLLQQSPQKQNTFNKKTGAANGNKKQRVEEEELEHPPSDGGEDGGSPVKGKNNIKRNKNNSQPVTNNNNNNNNTHSGGKRKFQPKSGGHSKSSNKVQAINRQQQEDDEGSREDENEDDNENNGGEEKKYTYKPPLIDLNSPPETRYYYLPPRVYAKYRNGFSVGRKIVEKNGRRRILIYWSDGYSHSRRWDWEIKVKSTSGIVRAKSKNDNKWYNYIAAQAEGQLRELANLSEDVNQSLASNKSAPAIQSLSITAVVPWLIPKDGYEDCKFFTIPKDVKAFIVENQTRIELSSLRDLEFQQMGWYIIRGRNSHYDIQSNKGSKDVTLSPIVYVQEIGLMRETQQLAAYNAFSSLKETSDDEDEDPALKENSDKDLKENTKQDDKEDKEETDGDKQSPQEDPQPPQDGDEPKQEQETPSDQ